MDLGADAAVALELLALVDPLDHLLEPAQPPVDALPAFDEEIGRQREVVDSLAPLAVEAPKQLLDGAAELGDELLVGLARGVSAGNGADSSAAPTAGKTSTCPSGRG